MSGASSNKHPGNGLGGLSRSVALILVIFLLTTADGCTRRFFRVAADKEVNDILAEKDRYGIWPIRDWHVYPDGRARFADPTNPDHPPMPPDDIATDQLSPRPQQPGKGGVGRVEGTGYLDIMKTWDEANRKERTEAEEKAQKENEENPDIASGSGLNLGPVQELFDEPLRESKGFVLTMDQACELGLINSRDYQRFREALYLQALPVTAQRFSFAWQWTAIEQAIRQWAGPGSLEGHENNWTLGTTVGVSKLFSTGALLTSTFANTTVFNFLKPGNGLNSVSTINLDFVQPLLAGGGKAVTLEPLTQAERSLLYNIRAYWRFREQFYMLITLGSSLPPDLPTAAATLTSNPISTLAALNIASTDVSGGFVGYLSTLFREVDMAVDKKLVVDLKKALKILEGYQEGGMFSPLQVQQVNSTLLNAVNGVLTDQQFVVNALDQFKLVLGVPANLPLILDDAPARPITRQFDRYYAVIADAEAAYRAIEELDKLPADKMREALLSLYTTDKLVRGTKFRKEIIPVWDSWRKLSNKEINARIQQLNVERDKLLDTKTDLEMKGTELPAPDLARLREIELGLDVGHLEEVLRRYEQRSWEKRPKDQQTADRLRQFRLAAYSAQIVLVAARNERFDTVSTLWPELPPAPLPDCGGSGPDLLTIDVNEAQDLAVEAAMKNRVDLMNARAEVVDAWRQLRVTANALMGIFNVGFHLDSTTPPIGANPLAFASQRTNAELILQPELPLVRVTQRNNYRTAIINYQQARRNLINLEDNIAAQVRFDVRQLRLFANNYRIQKTVIRSLYFQVENALEVIVAPADPDNLKNTGTAGQANAAALTSQYLGALSGLNGSQTKLYDIWLSYLATRMELYLDLERLILDPRGVWTDEAGKASLGQTFDNPASEPRPSGVPGGPVIPQLNPFGGPLGGLGAPVGGRPAAGNGPGDAERQQPRLRFLSPAAATPLE